MCYDGTSLPQTSLSGASDLFTICYAYDSASSLSLEPNRTWPETELARSWRMNSACRWASRRKMNPKRGETWWVNLDPARGPEIKKPRLSGFTRQRRREVQLHLDILLLVVLETHGLLAAPSRSGL